MRNRKEIIYAFIDSQNLNLGTSKDIYKGKKIVYKGWKLDYRKFRRYLANKFRVKKAYLFIGYIRQNYKLYEQLKLYGYDLIYKPTVKDNQGKPKGNIDTELVLHAATIEFLNYDKAVVVSGDGDFHCLYKFLKERKKLSKIIIPNHHSESSLLREFQEFKIFLYREKENLEYKR